MDHADRGYLAWFLQRLERAVARSVRARVNDHGILIALIGAVAVVVAAVLPIYLGHTGANSGNSGPSGVAGAATTFAPTAGGIGRPGEMTVEDDVVGGAWALTTPTARRLAPREHRPANAQRWIANGTNTALSCAKPATAYRVIVNSVPTSWRWWAKLKASGLWVPMAAFRQTKIDGSSGLPRCS